MSGWVQNDAQDVEILVEGSEASREKFLRELKSHPPEAAPSAAIDIRRAGPQGLRDFVIRASPQGEQRTTRVSPDLPVCPDCLAEMYEPGNRRYDYPSINCTNCGPRYTVILGLASWSRAT